MIRGYAAPASGGSAQWVIGARQFGGYTDDMAAWGLNFDQALDRGQTISRLEDVWGRVTHQYDYLDVPGYRRKNQHQVRAYAYNAEGQVIGRRDFWAVGAAGPDGRAWQQTDMLMPNRRLVISNGQSWAEVTEGAPARNELPEVEALQSLTGRGYAAGGGSVAAQANETLQSVSQRVYGDARYWYVLAEANGIGRPDEPLAGGTLLRVPALQVGFNAAGTARPYSADAALGSAMPALPYIAPSPQNCGVVGQLLMVAVAVIATVYTAGMAGMAMGVVPTGSGLAATMSTGVAVLGGSAGGISAAAMLGAATLGGAAGSIASQAVGLATGHVQNFSWRGVATGALTAGVGAGVGAAAQAFGWTRTATAVASGLGSSLAQAGVNGGFSWRQVAANVIGNAAGSAVGNAVGGRLGGALGIDLTTPIGQFQQQLLSGFVGGMVSQATSSLLGSGRARVDLASAAGDALGQALVGRWSGRHADAARQQAQAHEAVLQRASQRMQERMQQRSDAQLAALDERMQQHLDRRLDAQTASMMQQGQRSLPLPEMGELPAAALGTVTVGAPRTLRLDAPSRVVAGSAADARGFRVTGASRTTPATPPGQLTMQDLEVLRFYKTHRDRDRYWSYLCGRGDAYACLALGVVRNDTLAGVTANRFAEAHAADLGVRLSERDWERFGVDLMGRDFAYRESLRLINLPVRVIDRYHTVEFERIGLDAYAWTAHVPLNRYLSVGDDAGAEALWRDMLADGDFRRAWSPTRRNLPELADRDWSDPHSRWQLRVSSIALEYLAIESARFAFEARFAVPLNAVRVIRLMTQPEYTPTTVRHPLDTTPPQRSR